MSKLANAQYNVAAPDSLPVRLATYQRRRMFDIFLREFDLPSPDVKILDVGVTSDRTYSSSNYLEAWYPHKHCITAAGIDDASFLETQYPGMTFTYANAKNLPFPDRHFDVVHSSAVLEHVGSFSEQSKMIAEVARVSKRGFFLTTPNRWFPIEFHTVLPLVHWLPKPTFRRIMDATGRGFFAKEENLNLMSSSEIKRAIRISSVSKEFAWDVKTATLGFWPSNLLLIARRIL
ncbi:class I SAM-dependent methyltransferase [Variibacter gotjawalensis]|nr:class I SAM-dependent methyltransferase [Variibacter gotjawalensis]NIK47850.1 SAM-dependent methyltransferase [Variibacter gotjawalensis]